MSVQDNIYRYFDSNPGLRVLFVFNPLIKVELTNAEWKEGYHAVAFDGGWFKTKYALENEWKELKTILLFDFISPADAGIFPLMDVLAANMEYKAESYEAFLQQHRLNVNEFGAYIQRHIGELQLQKFDKILHDYYTPETFSINIANRGFITGYLSENKLMEWEDIVIRLFTLSLPGEEKKENSFYTALNKNKDAKDALDRELHKIFNVTYDPNSTYKMKCVAESMMYNAITQSLAVENADNYKKYKIHNAIQLDYINKLLSYGLNQPKVKRDKFIEALNFLSADIKVEEIVKVYGIDALYFYMPDELCLQIINRALETVTTGDAECIRERMQELRMKQEGNELLIPMIDYAAILADFYHMYRNISTYVLNSPEEYVSNYMSSYYLLDNYYRKSLEIFTNLPAEFCHSGLVTKVKHLLDVDYANFCNTINREWNRCWLEKGGRQNLFGTKRQQDIYSNERKTNVKQVFIVSDALRYEVATDLYNELAKEKHIAQMDYAIAMLPTETKYTKTALLPHRVLSFQDSEMAVDGKVLRTNEQRSEHLNNYVDGALCIDYADWEKKSLDEKRELCKRPLIYIFHNTIDRDGHDAGAYELTRACTTAVSQLSKLIKSLHASVNVTSVVLTSDHGFLYNDMDFEEKDKQCVTEENIERKTRYYLTSSKDSITNVDKFYLRDVSEMDGNMIVAVPSGTNRFNAPGGGYSFTHGGASLQEMIIPVIRSRQKRVDKTGKVGVTLISRDLRMVSSRLKFQIIQSEAVSMEIQERTIICAVYDNDRQVTAFKEIKLSSTDNVNPANRIFDVELVLNTSTHSNLLQLRIYDKNDDSFLNPLVKESVKNNTIIEQDF